MARNFRKQNVFVIATSQREKDPDPELRENFNLLIRPEINEARLTWRVWQNRDAEYSNYYNNPNQFASYPDGNPDVLLFDPDGAVRDLFDYPVPAIPWLFLAFDSRHKVPLEFQAPLSPEKSDAEANALMAWIRETDTGGVFSNYYSREEVAPGSELKAAVKAWDVSNRKMYSENELLLIVQDFKRKFHKVPEPEPEIEKMPAEKPEPEIFVCECGLDSPNQASLDRHVAGVKNAIRGLSSRKTPKDRIDELLRLHPKIAASVNK
jgi:hypothetical protein